MRPNKQFISFFKRTLIFLSPVLVLLICYFIFDPFYVLKSYNNYGSNNLKCYNRNKISTDVFLEHNPKYKFESFIFGSSRSSAFTTKDWSPFINDPHPFHFDAFDENLKGILGKMKYINKQGNRLKNVILVVCEDTFNDKFDEDKSAIHLKDPRWSDLGYLEYHGVFIKSFFLKNFFIAYLDLKFTKKYKPYMADFFSSTYHFGSTFNDFTFPVNEADIRKDSLKYFSNKIFSTKYLEKGLGKLLIGKEQEVMLEELRDILKENNSNYKIIIGPNFQQNKYNPKDLEKFYKYLGKENIYDYSGENKYSVNIGNFYEPFHYRPAVGQQIMAEIYGKK